MRCPLYFSLLLFAHANGENRIELVIAISQDVDVYISSWMEDASFWFAIKPGFLPSATVSLSSRYREG